MAIRPRTRLIALNSMHVCSSQGVDGACGDTSGRSSLPGARQSSFDERPSKSLPSPGLGKYEAASSSCDIKLFKDAHAYAEDPVAAFAHDKELAGRMIRDRAWISRRLNDYRYEYYWYDVLETCRKVLVIGLVQVFFPSSKELMEQLLIGMMLTSMMLTILTYMTPYRSRVDNVLATICQSSLLFQVIVTLVTSLCTRSV